MAIGDDFTVNTSGDIRHASGTTHYTVLELHRWLQDLADDEQASGNDLIDITTFTPSERSTNSIIELLDHSADSGPTFNIDDDAAEYFYGGSIKQKGGNELYSGLQVLGAVDNVATQLKIIQDNDEYQYTPTPGSPFWGTQSGGGYNGDAAGGVLMRVLIKSRINGADIDQKQIRIQSRHWGNTYDFFKVTLGEGEAVGAIGTTPDAQNDTAQGTVQGWTGGDIPTNVEGWQLIDLNNGSGDKEYYSKWTYNTNAAGLKAIWEWGKDITNTGTASTIHSMDGELFLGISHSVVYNNESGTFTEDEVITWGTDVTYDTLAGGTFTVGNYIVFSGGAAGKVLYDNGTTSCRVALEDPTITIANDETMTEYNTSTGSTGVTAAVNVTVTNNDKYGGEAALLALDDDGATGNLYIQLLTGTAPVTGMPLRGRTSAATADVNGAPSLKTLPKTFLGSYTGTIIGAYGIGIDPDDLTSSDSVQPLVGAAETPPNNQTFYVYGLVSGEDRVLLAPRTGSVIDVAQLTLSASLSGVGEIAVVVTTAIPADTPQTGTIRIQLNSGIYKYQAYTSWTGSTFTIASTDFSGDPATAPKNVFISYIDKLAGSDTESVALVYDADRNLFGRVRDGGGTPIKTYEANAATFTATGGSITASRISDA